MVILDTRDLMNIRNAFIRIHGSPRITYRRGEGSPPDYLWASGASTITLTADPEFDGYPTLTSEEIIDDEGHTESNTEDVEEPSPEVALGTEEPSIGSIIDETHEPKWRDKYYVDGSEIRIAADQVYEIDPSGSVLKVVKYTDYTADQLREIYTASSLKSKWKDRDQRRNSVFRRPEAHGRVVPHKRHLGVREDRLRRRQGSRRPSRDSALELRLPGPDPIQAEGHVFRSQRCPIVELDAAAKVEGKRAAAAGDVRGAFERFELVRHQRF
jgi:hypothetical protein